MGINGKGEEVGDEGEEVGDDVEGGGACAAELRACYMQNDWKAVEAR